MRDKAQSVLWFMPLPHFIIGFGLFIVLSFVGTTATSDAGALPSLGLTLTCGILLTAVLVGSKSLRAWQNEDEPSSFASRALFGKSRNNEPDNEPSGSNETDQASLRHTKRISSVRRDARKVHDRVLRMGAILGVSMVGFWFYMNTISGATPKEVFLLPWVVLAVFWFIHIVVFAPWLTYCAFFSVVGMRIAFEVWGETILILLPNFLMLPLFYFFMMIFMFGSMMLPNFMQFKFYKPGDATWEVPKGTMRGQPQARADVEMEMEKFERHAKGLTNRPATRGMIFEGPPGTGKTLLAKELGSEYDLPFAFTDAQAFNAPFMGFGPLIVHYFKWRVEALAKEYGGAIVFIDEAEQLLMQRSGMGMPGGGQGAAGSVEHIWDMFPYDDVGRVRFGNMLLDVPAARHRYYELTAPSAKPYSHPIFMGGMGGGGMGAGASIFPFLTWLNGADGPPLMQKIMRRKFNDLLSACFVPAVAGKRILRLPPGKPVKSNLMFIAATNRAWMLDDAIRRPGRFGVTIRFKTPDIESRKEVVDLYFAKSVAKGEMQPELYVSERIDELARATQGMSPAEIESVIDKAPDVRSHHVTNLTRIKKLIDAGTPESDLLEDDLKYWKRNKNSVDQPGWDDMRADWHSFMEARSQVLYGRAAPGLTSDAHRETTAVHEFMGHFIELKAFMGDQMRPQVLTVMPRGSALGMVAYVPIEERDPMPQSSYEAMLRVSIGSVMAERFFYNENQPGVVSDLENGTSIACFMVSKCAMVPYGWGKLTKRDKERYQQIGESFRYVSEASPLNMGAKSLVEKVMADPAKREKVEVFLGMAAVDAYRLIRANARLCKPVVDDLLEVDEFAGKRLEDLWQWLDEELRTFTNGKMKAADLTCWPDRHFAAANPFYGDVTSEAEEVLS